MEDDARRNRGKNYTSKERDLFLSIAKNYLHIIENKETRKGTLQAKRLCWRDIAREFNQRSFGESRTPSQLRVLYGNTKRHAAKRQSSADISKIEQEFFTDLFRNYDFSNIEHADTEVSTNFTENDPIVNVKTENESEIEPNFVACNVSQSSVPQTPIPRTPIPIAPKPAYIPTSSTTYVPTSSTTFIPSTSTTYLPTNSLVIVESESSKRRLDIDLDEEINKIIEKESNEDPKKRKLLEFKLQQAQVELDIKKVEFEIKNHELEIRKQELLLKRKEAEMKLKVYERFVS